MKAHVGLWGQSLNRGALAPWPPYGAALKYYADNDDDDGVYTIE